MSNVDDLREIVETLEEAYDVAKRRLQKDMPNTNPLLVITTTGQYILLDSLTVIVRARTVLAQLEET